MRRLYHHPLCPFSRKIRLALSEKGVEVSLIEEKVWERRGEFLAINPAGQAPVFVERDGATVCDSAVIVEYLEEVYTDKPLLPAPPLERAEARRLTAWFDGKFNQEVTVNLLHERVYKRLNRGGHPVGACIKAGSRNIRYHLDYIGWLMERRNWLAGDGLTIADFAAAAHLSCLDYVSDVPWDHNEPARQWYARVKSRPAFRPLLADHLPAMPPPAHYADLDF